MSSTLRMTGRQQPPSAAKNTANHQRPSHLCARVCARRSAWPCQQLHPSFSPSLPPSFPRPSGFPTHHVPTSVALHFGRSSLLRSPVGKHAPSPSPTPSSHPQKQSCPVSSKKKNSSAPSPPEGTTQPKITGHISTFICIPEQAQTLQQQLLDLSQAQIDF